MTNEDVHRLFDFLDKLYAGKKYPRDKPTIAIWKEVLKAWTYEQVREAVLQRTQTTYFRPNPSELVPFLPAVERPESTPWEKPSPEMVALVQQGQAEMAQRHERLRALRIPTLAEARAQGMKVREWFAMVGDDSPMDGV